MMAFVLLLNLGILTLLVHFFRIRFHYTKIDRLFFWALGTRLLGGLAVGLLYFYWYGGGDTFNFQLESELLSQIAHRDPQEYLQILWDNRQLEKYAGQLQFFNEPRSLFFCKILSVFNLITQNNYWINGLYFSTFSFMGCWFLAGVLSSLFPKQTWPIAIAFLFFPSIVFWGSGILKDSLSLAAIAFMSAVVLKLLSHKYTFRWAEWLGLILLALVLWKLKYYVAAILIPVLFSLGVILTLRRWFPQWFVGFRMQFYWAVLMGLGLLAASQMHYNLRGENIFGVIANNYFIIYSMSDLHTAVEYNRLSSDPSSFIRNLPLALSSGLFRPYLWEANGILPLLTSIENLLLMALAAISLPALFFSKKSETHFLLFVAMAYICTLATLIAFAAPNFGTLSRYKIVYLPFVVFILSAGAQQTYFWAKQKLFPKPDA